MKKKISIGLGCFLALLWVFSACVKELDSPIGTDEFNRKSNLSIQALRAMHFNGNFEYLKQDLVIEGWVVADDRTDNFYKTIVIQDSTAAIQIRLDEIGLYNQYPIGALVSVNLMGLWMGDYAKMIQLGAGVDRSDPQYPSLIPVPSPLISLHLSVKSLQNTIPVKTLQIDELTDNLQSCLIRFEQIEFAVQDTGKPYADKVNKVSENLLLKQCNGGSIYLRTSGFASFASAKSPKTNGSITGIYSQFQNTKQLIVRDSSDIRMNGLRCADKNPWVLFSEHFDQVNNNDSFALLGWKNIQELGTAFYKSFFQAGNGYLEISAFATANPQVKTWLISPLIQNPNLLKPYLSFKIKDGYDNGATMAVYYSQYYEGGAQPWKSKWTLLNTSLPKGSLTGFAPSWTYLSKLNLPAGIPKLYLAFVYQGGDPPEWNLKKTTSFQIDEIQVGGT